MEAMLEFLHIEAICTELELIWIKIQNDTDIIFENLNHFEILMLIIIGYFVYLLLMYTINSPTYQRVCDFLLCKTLRKVTMTPTEEGKQQAEEYWGNKTVCKVKNVYSELPMEPLQDKEFKRIVDELSKDNDLILGTQNFGKNKYKSSKEMHSEVEKLSNRANGIFFKSNPMHYDLFEGNCQMEAEVIKMCANIYKGDVETCGVLDCSEADCIRNALLSYRAWSKDYKGITIPNVIAPQTFDPSLNRAGELLDVEIRRIPVDNNAKMSPKDIAYYVDENTIAIFLSNPDGTFGVFDSIKSIAEY